MAEATLTFTVTADDTAIAVGSGSLPVLGTPRLLAWFEAATCAAIAADLGDGETSVGTRVELEHLVAAPVGMDVTATATDAEPAATDATCATAAPATPTGPRARPPRPRSSGRGRISRAPPARVVPLDEVDWADETAVAALAASLPQSPVVGVASTPLPPASACLLERLTFTFAPSGPGRTWVGLDPHPVEVLAGPARVLDDLLRIANAHGHLAQFWRAVASATRVVMRSMSGTSASVEERRAWVLSVLAFGDTAPAGFARVAGEGRRVPQAVQCRLHVGREHGAMPHGGFVIRSGKTGDGNSEVVEYSLRLDSNPEFTASVLVAFARAFRDEDAVQWLRNGWHH